MRRAAAYLAGLLLVLLAREPARAESESRGQLQIRRPGGGVRSVDVKAVWTVRATGVSGWGSVRVEIWNRDGDEHEFRVRSQSEAWGRAGSATRTVRVAGGERGSVWLPRFLAGGESVEVSVSGRDSTTLHEAGSAAGSLEVVSILGRLSDVRVGNPLEKAMQAGRSGPSGDVIHLTELAVADLPPTWTHLTAASLVVVDGAVEGLDGTDRQRLLLDYVEAGGVLVVLRSGSLPAGPLSSAIVSIPSERGNFTWGRHGLGRWATFSADRIDDEPASHLVDWWTGDLRGTSFASAQTVPPALALPEGIPGVGRVPVRLFFFLILGFAILVGPVAYVLLRRRRRLTALVAVVPAVGLVFTGAILGFGLLSEGLGTRGVIRSFTVLDQRTHEAATAAGRTLFASFGPSKLSISPDTVVFTIGDDTRSGGGVQLDLDASSLDGSILPSRTITALATVSRARARERIRFHRGSGGLYEVLTAEGFEPVPDGWVVFRAQDGTYHAGRGARAPLYPVKSGEVEATLREAFRDLAEFVEPEDEEDPAMDPWDSAFRRRGWRHMRRPRAPWDEDGLSKQDAEAWAERLVRAELPLGSYLAWTTRAPGLDLLGLDVEWKSRRHLVMGLLAPEDVDG